MTDDNAKAKLLSTLQSRGIPLGLDDIEWAFRSETTKKEAIAWIEEYLSDATLLTRDELDLYKAIGDSTKLELSSVSHDVVPLLDRDIKEAIAALKSSTSAIENHVKALEVQKEILMQLRRDEGLSNGTSRTTAKYAQEKSGHNFAIEDSSFSVNEQLREAEDQADKSLATLRTISVDRLAADEQVLDALSGLSEKALSTSAPATNHTDLEKWLQSLAALRAGEVRARIDAMLASAGPMSKEVLGDEGTELEIELQTLKDEIDSVVHMAIGHELRNPLMKSLEVSENGSRHNRRRWAKYLLSTLEYLIAQLDGASTLISDLHSFIDVLVEIRATVSFVEDEGKTRDNNIATINASLDVRHNSSSTIQSPNSSAPTALRRLNVKPSLTPSEDISQLDTLLLDSLSKLQAQYSSTEKIFIDTLSKSLAPQQQDALAILQGLYATSSFSTIHLSDEGLNRKIRDLGKRIDELAPRVASGDLR